MKNLKNYFQQEIGLFLLLAWIEFVSQLSGLEVCDEWTDDEPEWVGDDDDDEDEGEGDKAEDCLLLTEWCLAAFFLSWAMLDDDRLFSLNAGDSDLCCWVGDGRGDVWAEPEADSFDET